MNKQEENSLAGSNKQIVGESNALIKSLEP